MKETAKITIILLALVAIACSPGVVAAQNSHRIQGEGWWACTEKDQFSKLTGYLIEGDKDAFKQSLLRAVMSGTATIFADGETVYLTDTAIWSGLVKLRRRGEVTEYWTNMEAIRKEN